MRHSAQDTVWVRHNDHSQLRIPPLGQWTPTLTVSILIPAHNHQDKLNLVLAALAAQTYPDHLTEVVIADDNSQPPLHLPDITPTHTRLITTPPTAWGSAHAVNTAAAHANGHILLRLDADMLTYHHHVESQLRYHHTLDYAAVIGHKLFTDHTPHQHTPTHIHHTVHQQQTHTLHNMDTAEPHWIEQIIGRTDMLRGENHLAYRVVVGASLSVSRSMFHAAGGMDASMILGGDTEFGYRLAQAGAVFIPDHDSSSWHLGRTQIQSRREEAKRFRKPYLANRMPQLYYRDSAYPRQWATPLAEVVVDVGAASLSQAELACGPLLADDRADLRVCLVGEWPDDAARHAGLDDPAVESRLIREAFRGDPRVRFASAVPAPDPRVPYRLVLPPSAHTTRHTVSTLVSTADARRAGLLEVRLPDGASARLERHAAFARARRLLGQDPEPEAVDDAVDEVYGVVRIDAARPSARDADVVDALSTVRRLRGHGRGDAPEQQQRAAGARRDLAEAQAQARQARRAVKRQRRRLDRISRNWRHRTRAAVKRLARKVLPTGVYAKLRG